MSSASSRTMRVAVIDSDSGFLRVLTRRFESNGWEYRVFSSAVPADELIAMRLDALVVDMNALGPHAWDFLQRVSSMVPDLGTVVCSQATLAQRIRGLRLGADDWISKPCHPEEVLARIEAVSRRRRRSRPPVDVGPMVAGEIEIRADQFQAFVSGQGLGLTRREFELLQTLADTSGRVIEREDIYQRVWGYTMAHGDRSVDVFVRKLRAKLDQASPGWDYIHTHFGVGYRFEAETRADPQRGAAEVPAPDGGIDAEGAEDLPGADGEAHGSDVAARLEMLADEAGSISASHA
ncbi:MAG: response regulator transcription factor [Solirubrobacterales bacterium]|nr:response regulator transcription factor [Solirubrobacterales bacterium]